MSRVGNKIINVPEGVTVDIAADNTVTVTGAGARHCRSGA